MRETMRRLRRLLLFMLMGLGEPMNVVLLFLFMLTGFDSGSGFQQSWGAAEEAAELLKQAL